MTLKECFSSSSESSDSGMYTIKNTQEICYPNIKLLNENLETVNSFPQIKSFLQRDFLKRGLADNISDIDLNIVDIGESRINDLIKDRNIENLEALVYDNLDLLGSYSDGTVTLYMGVIEEIVKQINENNSSFVALTKEDIANAVIVHELYHAQGGGHDSNNNGIIRQLALKQWIYSPEEIYVRIMTSITLSGGKENLIGLVDSYYDKINVGTASYFGLEGILKIVEKEKLISAIRRLK